MPGLQHHPLSVRRYGHRGLLRGSTATAISLVLVLTWVLIGLIAGLGSVAGGPQTRHELMPSATTRGPLVARKGTGSTLNGQPARELSQLAQWFSVGDDVVHVATAWLEGAATGE